MLILNLDENAGMNLTTADGMVIRITNFTKGVPWAWQIEDVDLCCKL